MEGTGLAIAALSWVIVGVVVVLATIAIAFATGGVRRWRCVWEGQCDPRWQYNEDRPIAGSYGRITTPMRHIGVYVCSRCETESIGAARHEQASREVRGEPAEYVPPTGHVAAFTTHDFDLTGRCRYCLMTKTVSLSQSGAGAWCPGRPL